MEHVWRWGWVNWGKRNSSGRQRYSLRKFVFSIYACSHQMSLILPNDLGNSTDAIYLSFLATLCSVPYSLPPDSKRQKRRFIQPGRALYIGQENNTWMYYVVIQFIEHL